MTKCRILVVDDNEGYRLLVRLALAGSSFVVAGEASTLADGRSLAEQIRPDVVLVDLHLRPDASGAGLAALRAAAPGAIFVSISSLAGAELGHAGVERMVLLPRSTPPRDLPSALMRVIDQRPPGDVQQSERVRLPPEPASARAARHFTRDAMRRWGCGEDESDTVLLLLSEVVSNAILHARTELEVSVAVRPRRVRVEVVDGDTGPIRRRTSTEDAQSGRGTELVEALAEAWGTDRLTSGKRVWFEVASPGMDDVSGSVPRRAHDG